MGSSLKFDGAAVRSAAAALDSVADEMPLTLPVDLGDSGSSAVAMEAESFNMWAKMTAEVIRERIQTAAADARSGARLMESTDDDIADKVTDYTTMER